MLPHFSLTRSTLLGLAALTFVLLFTIFFPSFYVSIDEHQYLKNAFLIPSGSIVTDQPALYCGGNPISETQSVSSQSIGKSFLLLPFTLLPFEGIFLQGLLTHLLNFFLLILILRASKLSPAWSILYLFFPAFQWSARTLFPELNVLTFFLAAYYFWVQEKPHAHANPLTHPAFLSGFLLGLACLIRVDAAVGLLAFGAQALLVERKKLVPVILGSLLPLAFLYTFNTLTYGGGLTTGYGSLAEQTSFGLSMDFFISLVTYIILLLVALPLSLYAAARHSQRVLFLVFAVFALLFVSYFSPFWHFGFSFPLTFTARLRYFIPLLGLLMIPTFTFYEYTWKKYAPRVPFLFTNAKKIVIVGSVLIVLASLPLHAQHDALAQSRAFVSEKIHEIIPPGSSVVGSADDCIYFMPAYFGKYYYHNVASITQLETLDKPAYVLDISYFTQENKDTNRQVVIEAERGRIKKLIQENQEQLTQTYTDDTHAHMTIWKVNE